MEKDIDNLVIDLEANREDTLYLVNCLQSFADIACSKEGLEILEKKRVPQKLIALLDEANPLVVPHALKLFYRIHPSELERNYPQVLNKIIDYCLSDNNQLLDYAVDFIAGVGRAGYAGRLVLFNHPQFKEKCLTKLGSTIISSDTLLKSRTLRCITDLLELHEEDPKEDSSKLSESIYNNIIEGEHNMTTQLLKLCKVPIVEIRLGAMSVLAVMAVQVWGQKELATHSNFIEWILDRTTEYCKEGKETKFEILKSLVKSPTTSRVFGGENYMKMRSDYKNGPYQPALVETE